jgi:hypothetical protein
MISHVARCTRLALGLLAPLLMGADCPGSTCPPAAPPMSSARAKEIDPTIETGLAVSTTHVFGDCRPADPTQPTTTCNAAGPCARERQALRVLAVPVNVSVPIAPECEPALAVEDAAEEAVLDARASEEGELVAALEPGRYTLLISSDDRCAVCALAEQGGACTIDITAGSVTVRDLVLDRSSR